MKRFESDAGCVLSELLRDEHLPENRRDFDRNQPAITSADRAFIDEKLGRIYADAVLAMQIKMHHNGGVNPMINETLLPDGIDGELDLDATCRILANHLVWDQQTD